MKSFLKIVFCGLVAFNLVGCAGDSSSGSSGTPEETKDRAQALVKEQNQLARELIGTQTPDGSWSEASLNSLEAKLNRLVQVESELRDMDGKSGVQIRGGGSALIVSDLRASIASARAEKVRKASAHQAQDQLTQLQSQSLDLEVEVGRAASDIIDMEADSTKDPSEIAAAKSELIPKFDSLISQLRQQEELIKARRTDFKNADDLEKATKTKIKAMSELRALITGDVSSIPLTPSTY